jgi:ADP-heptose:LPS heptosyltransferase
MERYHDLARRLATDLGARIVLFGSSEERALCASIAEGINGAVNLAGRASILESASAVDACDVVVTNDSAMSHVAAARRRPVVAIFGSTVVQFGFAPFRTTSTIVENVGLYCRPCTSIGRAECPERHFRCMLEIAPTDLLEAVARIADVASTHGSMR